MTNQKNKSFGDILFSLCAFSFFLLYFFLPMKKGQRNKKQIFFLLSLARPANHSAGIFHLYLIRLKAFPKKNLKKKFDFGLRPCIIPPH